MARCLSRLFPDDGPTSAQLALDRDGRDPEWFTAFATDARKGQLADLDLWRRQRTRCEELIRNAKDTGLRNLPLKGAGRGTRAGDSGGMCLWALSRLVNGGWASAMSAVLATYMSVGMGSSAAGPQVFPISLDGYI